VRAEQGLGQADDVENGEAHGRVKAEKLKN
jgi:hypothetical protein